MLNGDSIADSVLQPGHRPGRAVAAQVLHDRGERRLQAGEIHNNNTTLSSTPASRALWRHDWNYEALLGYSQNKLKEQGAGAGLRQGAGAVPRPIAGHRSGQRIPRSTTRRSAGCTPRSPWRSSARSPRTRSITTRAAPRTRPSPSTMPVCSTCRQVRSVSPASPSTATSTTARMSDPLSLDGTYFGLHNTGAVGSRDHYGARRRVQRAGVLDADRYGGDPR